MGTADGFEKAMLELHTWWLQHLQWNAKAFRSMVWQDGGVDAAIRLVEGDPRSAGYMRLLEAGRLDKSVEALVVNEKWCELFDESVLRRARDRLRPG